jgi:hypothetical protein
MRPGVSRWQKLLRTGSISWTVRPLDLFRRRLTSGLEVGAGQQEARRGGELEVLVTISSARGLGDVEVGLVCTEFYDEEDSWTDGQGHTHTSRTTSDATAHEVWLPVESAAGVQSIRFTIPPDAPFSYKGNCLSFKWEVVARGRRPHRLDAQARREISILP